MGPRLLRMQPESTWFLTAPSEPVLVRRGDPLGLRGASNRLADLLAPGLTTRTRDARWLTLLSWSLSRANEVHAHYDRVSLGDSPGRSPRAARALYAWLRPLELLWIARTLTHCPGPASRGRQLPGQRGVARWLETPRQVPTLGLTPDQLARYRQVGAYGAYRTLLRRLPGLTRQGDGWRPEPVALTLARRANTHLRAGRPHLPGKRRRPEDLADYWLRHGWPGWEEARGRRLLPESSRGKVKPLMDWEQKALRPPLFGESSPTSHRRAAVARQCSGSSADGHAALCDELAEAFQGDAPPLAVLPIFTRLADAGVEAMNALWEAVGDERSSLGVPLARVVRLPRVQTAFESLGAEASRWETRWPALEPGCDLPGIVIACRLAEAFAQPRLSRGDLARRLVGHHHAYGGGVRWVRIHDGNLLPIPPVRDQDGSYYRFRLWPLCRMAIQCGVVTRMPPALRRDLDVNEIEGPGEGDEA